MIDPHFHDLPVLIERLIHGTLRAERRVVFLVGAPLSAPEQPGNRGVPGVNGIIELIRKELGPNSSAGYKLAELLQQGPQRYQAAFELLLGYRGQDTANTLIQKAVLEAHTDRKILATSSPVNLDPTALEALENSDEWILPPGVRSLGKILSAYPATFGHTVLTSNFDPLIEVSIRLNGGRFYRTVLHSDGDFTQTSAEGCHVVHFHGYWRGYDTLHTPSQLVQERPKLKQALSRLLGSSTVVVLGYSGWDDIFTKALIEVVIDDNARPDVLWTFLGSDPASLQKERAHTLSQLAPGINRGRVSLYGGIDCNTFMPRLLEELSDERSSAPIRLGTSVTSRLVEVTETASKEGRFEIRIQIPQATSQPPQTDSPPYFDEWVGRAGELQLLEATSAPAVVITGIGGQGKSALAAHYLQLATPLYEAWDWRDCKEEGDRINTQLIRIIARVAGDSTDESSLEACDVRSLIDVLFGALAERRWLFVFDNVDHYVDLVTGQFLSAVGQLYEAVLSRRHRSRFIFTCRPEVKTESALVLRLPLTGLSEPESMELFRRRGVPSSDQGAMKAAIDLTSGHPMWINIISMQVVRLKRRLIDVLADIRRGTGELPEKTLRSIWGTLNNNQHSLLRTLAEVERPETQDRLSEMVAHMTLNRFLRSIRTLQLLQLVVVRSRAGEVELLELHPLVKSFIRREFPRQDRDPFISAIITFLDRMIGKYKGLLDRQPSIRILDHWMQKAELDINRGRYESAILTLMEVSKALISRGYGEELVRIGKKLLGEIDWAEACVSYRDFDQLLGQIVEVMVQLGQYDEVDDILQRYADAMPGVSTQYIHLCNLRCYRNWYAGRFDEAITWGEQGEALKAASNVDTGFSTAHNLALARRDGGKVDAALQFFLSGQALRDVLDPEKTDKQRDGAFYGNIGRCLQFKGDNDKALIVYRKSARLVERDSSERASLNRGYIRLWIGEVLAKRNSVELARLFFRAAFHQWRTISPPRAKEAERALRTIDPQAVISFDPDPNEVNEVERTVRAWLH